MIHTYTPTRDGTGTMGGRVNRSRGVGPRGGHGRRSCHRFARVVPLVVPDGTSAGLFRTYACPLPSGGKAVGSCACGGIVGVGAAPGGRCVAMVTMAAWIAAGRGGHAWMTACRSASPEARFRKPSTASATSPSGPSVRAVAVSACGLLVDGSSPSATIRQGGAPSRTEPLSRPSRGVSRPPSIRLHREALGFSTTPGTVLQASVPVAPAEDTARHPPSALSSDSTTRSCRHTAT